MSVGFGFSAGDIITGLILIKNSIGAIHDTKGAQVDYRGLIQALDSLESGLEVVHDLEQEGKVEPHSKPWIAIRNATSKCKACIDEFLTSIDKYKCLGTPAPLMSTWKANVRKIKWAVCKQTDVDIFRGRLEIHCRSVSMLLITLQVNLSSKQAEEQSNCLQLVRAMYGATTGLQVQLEGKYAILEAFASQQMPILETILASHRRLILTNERVEATHRRAIDSHEQMAYEFHYVIGLIKCQQLVPPRVLLQKPVTLLDACGEVAAFHLEFIGSLEAFIAVLKTRFKHWNINDIIIKMLDEFQF